MEQHWNLSSHASPISAINPALEGNTGWRATTPCRMLLWVWVPGHPRPGESPSFLACSSSSPQYHSSSVCKACGRKGERIGTEISKAAVACGNHTIIQAERDLRRSLVEPLLKAGSAVMWCMTRLLRTLGCVMSGQHLHSACFLESNSLSSQGETKLGWGVFPHPLSLEKRGPLVASQLATVWGQKPWLMHP